MIAIDQARLFCRIASSNWSTVELQSAICHNDMNNTQRRDNREQTNQILYDVAVGLTVDDYDDNDGVADCMYYMLTISSLCGLFSSDGATSSHSTIRLSIACIASHTLNTLSVLSVLKYSVTPLFMNECTRMSNLNVCLARKTRRERTAVYKSRRSAVGLVCGALWLD